MSNPIIDKLGNKFWFDLNDELHREDGPAIEYTNGSKYWYYHSKQHREDGPAIEYAHGEKLWYYYDKYIDCSSQEEFLKIIKLRMFW